jgi:ribonuclease BN (tRNA processing enzyme)
MSARLVVLGAGAILPRAGYGCAGYALELAPGGPLTLLDCGPGSLRALGAAGLGLERVRRVVFSHYHLDHCLDLFALAFARHNPAFAPAPRLELFGPPGLARLVEGAPAALGHWARDPDAELHEVEPDRRGAGGFESGGLAFRCVQNGHTPEAVSWRVELASGTALAYTGDTGPSPRVAELARGADLLVAECSFPEELAVPNHLTPRGAAQLAAEAGAARLLLTHFYPSLDPSAAAREAARYYDGPIETARDGSLHALGDDEGRS